jgi:hypothetical protein
MSVRRVFHHSHTTVTLEHIVPKMTLVLTVGTMALYDIVAFLIISFVALLTH